ncbi:hypothetical protein [Oceanospirillum sediminis]|uniref:Uncharacterized protein n=1 Tax=Oceanospirillum sediminis TaxID=2760088 RepID=A0A839IRJ1_9GAMM|nr:hypothetical protein [Oceanospirillum sediminis]MBB1487162.1 hypothetical protein [Oceanospirillum sediminis]
MSIEVRQMVIQASTVNNAQPEAGIDRLQNKAPACTTSPEPVASGKTAKEYARLFNRLRSECRER